MAENLYLRERPSVRFHPEVVPANFRKHVIENVLPKLPTHRATSTITSG